MSDKPLALDIVRASSSARNLRFGRCGLVEPLMRPAPVRWLQGSSCKMISAFYEVHLTSDQVLTIQRKESG